MLKASSKPTRLNANHRIKLRIEIRASPKHFLSHGETFDVCSPPCQCFFNDVSQEIPISHRSVKISAGEDPVELSTNLLTAWGFFSRRDECLHRCPENVHDLQAVG